MVAEKRTQGIVLDVLLSVSLLHVGFRSEIEMCVVGCTVYFCCVCMAIPVMLYLYVKSCVCIAIIVLHLYVKSCVYLRDVALSDSYMLQTVGDRTLF